MTENRCDEEAKRAECDGILAAARRLRDRAAGADGPGDSTPAYVFWERFVRELDLLRPPRCSAHGYIACPDCSRITPMFLTAGGDCTDCGMYGETGMHWDTCAGRIRGTVYANRAEAIAAAGVGGADQ